MKSNVKKLSEFCDITSSKRIFASEYVEQGVPFYRGKEIIEFFSGALKVSTDLFISNEKYSEIKKKFDIPKVGDLLLTSVGTLGIPYIVKDDKAFYFKDGNLTWFRNFNGLDSCFLYYWLISPMGKEQLSKATIGSSQSAYTIKLLSSLDIKVPEIETQKKIASTLSHYDDLIQTNQQRIALLEEAAQRLYDEWFVKLRFPNYQQVPVVDGVPEGWEKVTFADVCESVGGGTPSTKVNEYWENGDVSWVTPTDITRLSSLILLDTEKKITQKGLKESSTKMLPPDTILMTSRASIGYFGLIDRPVCTNQGFISIIPNNNADRMFILFNLKNRLEEIDGLATGSTFKELSRRVFRAMNITLPPEELRQSFSSFVQPLFEQMRTIAQQNQKLTQARDELLPRLMSGQLNVTKLTLTEIN